MKKHPRPLRVVAYMGDTGRTDKNLLRSIQKKHNLVGVITPFEAHSGRLRLPSDVERLTAPYVLSVGDKKEMKGILERPNSDYQKWLKRIKKLSPDVITLFNVNTWAPPELAKIPEFGSINFHPGPLPELAGPNPVSMACLEGREKMHGTVHRVEERFDSGDIVARTRPVRVGWRHPTEIKKELEKQGAKAMVEALDRIADKGERAFKPQEGKPTFATTPEMDKRSRIDWNSTTREILRQYNALASHYSLVPPKSALGGKQVSFLGVKPSRRRSRGGEPGEIVAIYKDKPIVKTGDGHVILSSIAPKLDLKKGMKFE